jgi:hypothetical protein
MHHTTQYPHSKVRNGTRWSPRNLLKGPRRHWRDEPSALPIGSSMPTKAESSEKMPRQNKGDFCRCGCRQRKTSRRMSYAPGHNSTIKAGTWRTTEALSPDTLKDLRDARRARYGSSRAMSQSTKDLRGIHRARNGSTPCGEPAHGPAGPNSGTLSVGQVHQRG